MKLSFPAFGFLSATFLVATNGQTLCGNYATTEIILKETCTKGRVKDAIRDVFDANPSGCPHNFRKELSLITGKTDMDSVNDYIDDLCDTAAKDEESASSKSTWKELTDAGIGLTEFYKGDGFLNCKL